MDDSRLAVNELVEARLAEGRPYGMGLGHGLKKKKYLNPFPKSSPDYDEYQRGLLHGQNTRAFSKNISDPDTVGGTGLRTLAGALLPGADFAVSVAQHFFSGKRAR